MRTSDRVHRELRREVLDGPLAAGAVLGEVEQAARLAALDAGLASFDLTQSRS